MTPEEIKILVKETVTATLTDAIPEAVRTATSTHLEAFKSEVRSEVDKANAGLASSLTKEIKALKTTKATKPNEPGDADSPVEVKALETRLADLTAQLAERDEKVSQLSNDFAAAQQAREVEAKRAAVSKAIADSGAINTGLLGKVLAADYIEGDKLARGEDGGWYVTNGDRTDSLSAALTTYLGTDEGKAFVAPSGVSGSGSTETPASPPPSEKKAGSRLEQIFSEVKEGKAKFSV